jgi:hypothetical protein
VFRSFKSILAICAIAVRFTSAAEPSFSNDIQPILQARCSACHGPDEKSANVNFAAITDDKSATRQRKLWRKVVSQLEAGAMPPSDEPQLKPEEKEKLLAWAKRAIETIDCNDPANRDPGPALVRRLTLSEYNRTVRDLLGFEFDAAAVGIADDVSEGNSFGNLAAALDMPPTLLEKYFAAADQILDRFYGVELSSSVDGRVQEQARVSREQMFSLKQGTWRKADFEVQPPMGMEPRDAARAIIASFTRRAYRGQATATDIDRLLSLFDRATAQEKSYGQAVRFMLKGVLVSPKFLFASSRMRPRASRAKSRSSAICNWPRDCRTSSGRVCQMMNCSISQKKANCRNRRSRNNKFAACSLINERER